MSRGKRPIERQILHSTAKSSRNPSPPPPPCELFRFWSRLFSSRHLPIALKGVLLHTDVQTAFIFLATFAIGNAFLKGVLSVALWYFYKLPPVFINCRPLIFLLTVALYRPLIFYQLFCRFVPHFCDPLLMCPTFGAQVWHKWS